MKRNFVAIENAANSSSVALLQVSEDEHISLSGRVNKAEQQHAEHILPMLDALLSEAQLTKQAIHGLVFSQGPGAFTGLRIACGVAQGLALGLGLDVVAVDSLRATASMVQNKQAYDLIVSVLDARMQEVYLAVYQPVAGANLKQDTDWVADHASNAQMSRNLKQDTDWAFDRERNARIGDAQIQGKPLSTLQAPVLIGVADVIPWLREQLIPSLKAQLKVSQARPEQTIQEQATEERVQKPAELSTRKIKILLCGNALEEYAQVFAQALTESQVCIDGNAAPVNQAHAGGNAAPVNQVHAVSDLHVAKPSIDSVGHPVLANSCDLEFHLGHTAWPSAEVLVQLGYEEFKHGRAMAAELVAPLYLRDKVAFTIAEREQGMGGNPKAQLPNQQTELANALTGQVTADLHTSFRQFDAGIEAMQSADIEAVLAIENRVQLEPWTAGMFADSLDANYKAWILRHCSGQIMGYALQMFAPDVAHLLTIAIAPEWQQKGLGRLLLRWTEQQVRESDLNAQMLEVRVSNQAARALYEAQSYQRIGLRKGYYRGLNGQSEDALVLQKNLL